MRDQAPLDERAAEPAAERSDTVQDVAANATRSGGDVGQSSQRWERAGQVVAQHLARAKAQSRRRFD